MYKAERSLLRAAIIPLLILCGFLTAPQRLVAQGYDYPGAVSMLSDANHFPRTPESMKWLNGFESSLEHVLDIKGANPCHYQMSLTNEAMLMEQSLLLVAPLGRPTGQATPGDLFPSFAKLHSLGESEEGSHDGNLFVRLHGSCGDRVQAANQTVAILLNAPLKKLDPDEEDFVALRRGAWDSGTPPSETASAWWRSLAGSWADSSGNVVVALMANAGQGKMAELRPSPSISTQTFAGGPISASLNTSDHSAMFYNCASRLWTVYQSSVDCSNKQKDHSMELVAMKDGSLSATIRLWVQFKNIYDVRHYLLKKINGAAGGGSLKAYTIPAGQQGLGSFFGHDMTPELREQAYRDLDKVKEFGQQTAYCYYADSGYTFYFWYQSVPQNYAEAVASNPHHPFRMMGPVSVNGCPAISAEAEKLKNMALAGQSYAYMQGVPTAPYHVTPVTGEVIVHVKQSLEPFRQIPGLTSDQSSSVSTAINEIEEWNQTGRNNVVLQHSFDSKLRAVYDYYFKLCKPGPAAAQYCETFNKVLELKQAEFTQ